MQKGKFNKKFNIDGKNLLNKMPTVSLKCYYLGSLFIKCLYLYISFYRSNLTTLYFKKSSYEKTYK